MSVGKFAFILHGHLPYVLSHGRWPHGTDWLSEAAAETYLPVIRIIRELVDEGLQPKLTMGLSPVLCEQLADNSFKEEFVTYLNQKIKAARYDAEEFRSHEEPGMLQVAHFWIDFYKKTLNHYESLGQEILPAFKKLQDEGYMELITCGATHGYYPLLSRDESLQVQTKMAVRNYQDHFGCSPRGIWLPECAYRPRYEWTPPVEIDGKQESYLRKGSDEFLSENGLDFFVIDSALLKGGKSVGVYIDRFDSLKLLWDEFSRQYKPREEETDKSPHKVYLVSSEPEGKKPTAVIARDPETGLLVWSGEHGYPGDGHYLDFHKKRFPGGHRYWAVTSSKADLADKVGYNREGALDRIPENAGHFVSKVTDILSSGNENGDKSGLLAAPYDAELFGHWWFEGPEFLKQVLAGVCRSSEIDLTFVSEYLDENQPDKIISIPEGSWGQGNNHYIWLNRHTEWTWKHIYECEAEMCRLALYWKENKNKRDTRLEDLLKQAGRELMLMSASDWQFLISTYAARDYAEMRISNHYSDFKRLTSIANRHIAGETIPNGDLQFLLDCKDRDRLFNNLEIEWFAQVEYPA
ncbi:MAG: DUF1957 domain-containing protein [bacterium]|nr:DUF1957 domain-containing protein [bacterium]